MKRITNKSQGKNLRTIRSPRKTGSRGDAGSPSGVAPAALHENTEDADVLVGRGSGPRTRRRPRAASTVHEPRCPSRAILPLSLEPRQSCCVHGPSDISQTSGPGKTNSQFTKSSARLDTNSAHKHQHSFLCMISIVYLFIFSQLN